jgi:cell wall-associated NlpC family hydrolase
VHPLRRTPAARLRALLQSAGVLLACLGLGAVSLAATGGAATDPGTAVVAAAATHLGDRYVWGGAGPHEFDCSGLTSTLWREVGGVTSVPRTSRQQQAWAVPLPIEQALPGDLVFFGDPVTHVGLVQSRTTTRTGTTVQMIDASSARKGVVSRPVWKTGTVRFGRVPRKGMVPVRPWTPAAAPKATPTPTPTPAPTPTAKPKAKAVAGPAPLAGLPRTQLHPSSPLALRFAALARKQVGVTTWADVDLVRALWRQAGGATLPTTRSGVSAAGRPVALADARVGDLVVYGPPASHVGIYVGNGLMVDASRSLGRVMLRPVWTSPSVQLLRLTR